MIIETEAKVMLSKCKEPSAWFGVVYNMNLYRGCTHRCIYCDSRSECYRIDNFDSDIYVKKNAIDLLPKELMSKRKMGLIGFGSMSDPYIPIEMKYQLTRKALKIIKSFRYPVFLITKSDLVTRDIDILCEINKQNYACVSFTITTFDDDLAKKIEPNAPLPSKRFEAMKKLYEKGIKVGITLMPLLPYINDNEKNIRNIVEKAHECGASFIVSGFGVTLRDRQRQYFYDELEKKFPNLKGEYIKKYKNQYSCRVPNSEHLYEMYSKHCAKYGISTKMPTYKVYESFEQLKLFSV